MGSYFFPPQKMKKTCPSVSSFLSTRGLTNSLARKQRKRYALVPENVFQFSATIAGFGVENVHHFRFSRGFRWDLHRVVRDDIALGRRNFWTRDYAREFLVSTRRRQRRRWILPRRQRRRRFLLLYKYMLRGRQGWRHHRYPGVRKRASIYVCVCMWERACVCVNSNDEMFFFFFEFNRHKSRGATKKHLRAFWSKRHVKILFSLLCLLLLTMNLVWSQHTKKSNNECYIQSG